MWKSGGGYVLLRVGKAPLLWTLSHGRGWGCRGSVEIESASFNRPSGTNFAILLPNPALEALGYFHRSLRDLTLRSRASFRLPYPACGARKHTSKCRAPRTNAFGARALHQPQSGAGAYAAGLRELAANAIGLVVRDHLAGGYSFGGDWLGSFHLLYYLQGF